MKYVLPPKLAALTPYSPVEGSFAVRLDANESFFPLRQDIKEQALQAVEQVAFNRYPDPNCTALCAAFGAFYHIDPSQITAGNGSDELLSILCSCFFQKGQRLLTFQPDFSMYGLYARLAELEVVVYPKGEDLTFDVQKVIAFAKEQQVDGILFSNPCNPTAQGLASAQVVQLVHGVDCLVLLDEAYMDFWEESLLPQVQDFENLIILRTCSKALGMAAVRLGFAIANNRLTKALRAAKSPYNVNAMSQAFATSVLASKDYLQDCTQQIIASREQLYQALLVLAQEKPALQRVFKPCTNFVFIQTSNNAEVFHCLAQRSIAIRNMQDYLRITTGAPEENQALLAALAEIL